MSDDLGTSSTMTQIAMGQNGTGGGSAVANGEFAALGGMNVAPPLDISQVSIGGFEAEGGGLDQMGNFGNIFSWLKGKGKNMSMFGIGHNLFDVQNLGVGSLDLGAATSLKSNLNSKISTIFSKSEGR
jgi:hypothetical protein